MLDNLVSMIASALNLTEKEVIARREELLAEQAQGGRYAAGTALEHPEGSTTPLNEAAGRAENTLARLRKDVEKDAPAILAKIIAMQIAEQRRDETAKARVRHWAAEYDRRDTGIHPSVRDHFARLFKHGAHPNNLKQHRDEEDAILADLSKWKAADATYADPDNHWRLILEVYAGRLLLKPRAGVTVKRSVSGTYAAPVSRSDPDHYDFGALLRAPGTKGDSTPSPGPVAAAPAKPTITTRTVDAAPATESVESTGISVPLSPDTSQPEPDEYALPETLPAAHVKAIREQAPRVAAAAGTWEVAIKAAIASAGSDASVAEIIAAVERAPAVSYAPPFRYFTEVAKAGGIEAGFNAFREAETRRMAFEIATAPSFANFRQVLDEVYGSALPDVR